MSKYLERTNASKPTFGDYVTLEMKCYGGPNEHFVHEVLSSPFISNSWRNVPIDARDPEEHLHDTSETVVAVRTQGINSRDAHIFAVRLADVLPMKGTNWSWRESPLRSRIAELEAENDRLQSGWFRDETICPDGSLRPKVSDLLNRIAELEAAQRWIPVGERLPKEEGWYYAGVLGRFGDHYTHDVYFYAEDAAFRWKDCEGDKVYCWLDGVPALPTPPEVQK